MATEAEVLEVRENTNEPSDEWYSDGYLSNLIDAQGVLKASASVWGKKASRYADLVDTSEAGASHKFSDLYKNALAMEAKYLAAATPVVVPDTTSTRPRVSKIARS